MTDSILKKPESEAPSFEGLYTNTPTDLGINTSSSIDWNQTINKEDSINRFYVTDNDVPYVDEQESTKDKVVKNVAGLGFEIGTGVGTDYATAPLLVLGPKGWAAYAVINFASGYSSNIAAQKIRGEDKFSYGEALGAGFFQMIPYGSTGKGVKGLAGAGLQGATTAAGEHTIRTRIDENRWPTAEEYAVSGTIGTIFGTGFKGTVDGLSGIYKKYNNKSAAEIDKLITKKEKEIIDEVLERTNVAKEKTVSDEIIPLDQGQNIPLTAKQIKDQIDNRIVDIDVEVAEIKREMNRLSKVEPNNKEGYETLFKQKSELINEQIQLEKTTPTDIDAIVKDQQTIEPDIPSSKTPTKLSDVLRGSLRNLAQSDARALRETDEILKEASELTDLQAKTTGRQKILPGTPHPTDAKKVRGYDGRWVTKKHFDQVTESKKGANEIKAQFDEPPSPAQVFKSRWEEATNTWNKNAMDFGDDVQFGATIVRREGDIDVLGFDQLDSQALKDLNLTEKDLSLPAQKQIKILKDNFNFVRSQLLPGEYQLFGSTERKRSIYAKWFKNDPDIEWFSIKDDTPAKPGKDSYAVLTVTPDSPRIGTQIPRGETAQSGAVFIERVDKGTGQTGPIQKAFNLPNTYDLAVLELQELNATQLAELGIKKADIAKLTPRQTINLLKKNFDNVRKDLLPGEYRMEGYSESRRKLYKKWFKDDPDVVWVDRQTGAASTIDDAMSIPYLVVKEPVDVGGGGAVPPRKPPISQGDGPLAGTDTTPHQINPDQVTSAVDTKDVKHKQRQFNFIVKRIKQLKDEGAFSQVKTTADTIDGGIKMTADKKKLKEYAQMYAKIYGLVPTDELNYALAETITLATRNSAEVNQRLIDAINISKDPISIEQNINELIKSIGEIDDWLRLGIPLRTEQGRGLRSMQIPTQGVSPAEFAKMSSAEKYKLRNLDQSSMGISSSEQSSKLEDLKEKILSAFEEAKQTGDYSKLNKFTNTIKRAANSKDPVEKMTALYETGTKHRIFSSFNKANRIFNEIGINALLSAPTTNEVNLASGVLETYMSSWELIRGAGSRTELDAAIRHLIALHSNASFARKAFKESFKMSDNWINRGAVKADYQEKFIISSEGRDIISRAVINPGGKVIRFPSQLMTSVDALIQAPNLIASIHYQGHIEGTKLGLKGKDLDNYIKGHLDAILEYYASNSGKGIKDPITAKILKRSQEFAKRSTFTEDIRDDGYFYFGKAAKFVNNMAGQIPLVRTLLSFIRTPTNIIKRQLRRTPVLNKGLRELANDLESTDPIVRNQARGQLKVAKDLGLTVAALTGAGFLMQQDPNFVPPVILTGGGPDWSTKEGRAVWKNMLKNGWQPYSVGYLQKNEDGSPLLGDDGKPTYKYYSYERLDPLSTWIGLMVDFVEVSGVLTDDEYDEFTTGWAGAFSRNLFDRSYLSQIDDAMKAITDDKGGEERENFWAKVAAARVPYANFVRYAKQLPGDLLGMAGVSEKDSARFKQKRDTKVRAGDVWDEEKREEDENARALRKYLNELSRTAPGFGGNLPFLREHITNDPILHPQKPGPDLFSWVKTSTSKGHPIFTALATIGKRLREPSDVINGSATDSQIESFRLNTQQYAELRSIVNTITTKKYGDRTLDQTLRAYLKSDHYNNNLAIVKKRGALNADTAVKQIYSKLQEINNYYIEQGENEWIKQQGGDKIQIQVEKKRTIQQEYSNDIRNLSPE